MTLGQKIVSAWLSKYGMYVIALDNAEAFRQLAKTIDEETVEKGRAESKHD